MAAEQVVTGNDVHLWESSQVNDLQEYALKRCVPSQYSNHVLTSNAKNTGIQEPLLCCKSLNIKTLVISLKEIC